ncbi:MAG: glycosyltransferase [Magnetococcales bacterium]|nr:glycosyltransferase [Magnetococcales bacterium]
MMNDLGEIALYLPDLPPGGAERTLLRLGKALIARGHRVVLVVDRAEGTLLPAVAEHGLTLESLEAPRTVAAIPRLTRWLKRRRPAILLSAVTFANLVALMAGRLARVPTRIVVSEHTVASQHAADHSNWQYRLVPFLSRKLYPKAAAVVAVAQGVADDLVTMTGMASDQIQVITNPVVTPEYPQRAAAAVDHPWLSDGGGAPVIVTAGRLVSVKDFPTMIRALGLLREQCPARLIIMGEGEDLEDLKALRHTLGLDESVDFAGFHPDPLPFYARADLVAVSSLFEGFGLTLVESMAVGTPVVSVDCPVGPREILQNGRYGPLTPVGDANALAQAMSEVLDAPLDSETLKASTANYTVEAVTDAYESLFATVVSEG